MRFRDILVLLQTIAIFSLVGFLYLEHKDGKHAPSEVPAQVATPPAQPVGEDHPYLTRQVKNTIRKKISSLQECYTKFLEGNPSTTDGKLIMDWQIALSGQAQNAQVVGSDFQNEELHTCMSEKINSWEFPTPPQDSFYVEHTFNFKKE